MMATNHELTVVNSAEGNFFERSDCKILSVDHFNNNFFVDVVPEFISTPCSKQVIPNLTVCRDIPNNEENQIRRELFSETHQYLEC